MSHNSSFSPAHNVSLLGSSTARRADRHEASDDLVQIHIFSSVLLIVLSHELAARNTSLCRVFASILFVFGVQAANRCFTPLSQSRRTLLFHRR
jgi:hypothetical protein